MEYAQLIDSERIEISQGQLADYCARWKIKELALFGSVLGDDFSAQSDIDVLVAFDPSARWTLFDHVDMQDELKVLFGRDVDLVTRRAIERSRNPIRRKAILDSAQVLYVA